MGIVKALVLGGTGTREMGAGDMLAAVNVPRRAGGYDAILDGKCTGSPQGDDTLALLNGLAEAMGAGLKYFLPAGIYNTTRPLTWGTGGPLGQVTVEGIEGKTFIRSTATGASFTGSISVANGVGTLQVASMSSGVIGLGSTLSCPGFRTTITGFQSGSGGQGTYTVQDAVAQPAGTAFTTAPVLVMIGAGNDTGVTMTGLPNGLQRGRVYGLNIAGPTVAPNDGSIALLLNGMTGVTVERCETNNSDIGYDAINNCFGSVWMHNRGGDGGTHRVGINIRGVQDLAGNSVRGQGMGNQGVIINGWHGGTIFGLCAGGTDGLTVIVGQIGNPAGADADRIGAVGLGLEYVAASGANPWQGGANPPPIPAGAMVNQGKVVLQAIDFEQYTGTTVSSFGQVDLVWTGSPVISKSVQGQGLNSRGGMTMVNAQNSNLLFDSLTVRGAFGNAKFLNISGAYRGFHAEERGTILGASTFAGVPVPQQIQSILWQGQWVGHASAIDWVNGRSVDIRDLVITATIGGVTQVSTDGVNYTPLAGTSTGTASSGTGAAGSGTGASLGAAPSSIAGLIFGASGDRLIGVPDGAAVTAWTDVSGSGNSATAASGSAPRMVASQLAYQRPPSCQPVLRFNQASFAALPVLGNAMLSGLAVMCVPDADVVINGVQVILGCSVGGGLCVRLASSSTGLSFVQMESDSVAGIVSQQLSVPMRPNRYYVLGWSYANSGAYVMTLDGAVVANGTSTVTLQSGAGVMQIGRNSSGAGFGGQVAELLGYSSALTAEQLLALDAGLTRKYALLVGG